MTGERVTLLVFAQARGVWAVRSASATVYCVDADAGTLLRVPGPGSSRGPGDNRWVPLMSVESALHRDQGVLRVGDRHRYLYDYDTAAKDYGWWIQREATGIEQVTGDELAALPGTRGAG